MSKPLSKSMLEALLALHRAPDGSNLDRGTIKALVARGLVDTACNITPLGSIKAIERLPLRAQCQAISIDLNTSHLASFQNPEIYCYNAFAKEGYIGSYCEGGGFGTAIKEGCLKFIEVKTTDRLHHSQLVTIPALVREINADVSVLQLVSANKSLPLRGTA